MVKMSQILVAILGLLFLSRQSVAVMPLRVLQDHRNKNLVWDHPITRIVALTPALAELVDEMGLGALLKGVPDYSELSSSVQQFVVLGSYVKPNIEAIVKINADLVIGSFDGNDSKTAERLEGLGQKVAIFRIDNLIDLKIVSEKIYCLLSAKMKDRDSCDFLDRYGVLWEKIKSHQRQKQSSEKVLLLVGHNPWIGMNRGTFVFDLLEQLGFNVVDFPHIKSRYPILSIESFVKSSLKRLLYFNLSHEKDLPSLVSGIPLRVLPGELFVKPKLAILKNFESLEKLVRKAINQ